jgi:hypothetical protein
LVYSQIWLILSCGWSPVWATSHGFQL